MDPHTSFHDCTMLGDGQDLHLFTVLTGAAPPGYSPLASCVPPNPRDEINCTARSYLPLHTHHATSGSTSPLHLAQAFRTLHAEDRPVPSKPHARESAPRISSTCALRFRWHARARTSLTNKRCSAHKNHVPGSQAPVTTNEHPTRVVCLGGQLISTRVSVSSRRTHAVATCYKCVCRHLNHSVQVKFGKTQARGAATYLLVVCTSATAVRYIPNRYHYV